MGGRGTDRETHKETKPERGRGRGGGGKEEERERGRSKYQKVQLTTKPTRNQSVPGVCVVRAEARHTLTHGWVFV